MRQVILVQIILGFLKSAVLLQVNRSRRPRLSTSNIYLWLGETLLASLWKVEKN